MKINLHTEVQNAVEMNFFPSLFDSTVTQLDRKRLTIRLLNNETTALLKQGQKCRVDFKDNLHRRVLIQEIARDNGHLLLHCRFAGTCPPELI